MRIVIEFIEDPKRVILSVRKDNNIHTESIPYSNRSEVIERLEKIVEEKFDSEKEAIHGILR